MATSRICSIPDCGKKLLARGYCNAHYQSICRRGYVPPIRPCRLDGCTGNAHAQGYCVKHYKRLLKHGDPLGGSTDWGAAQQFVEAAVVHADKEECLTWPFAKSWTGLAQIRIGNKTHNVCRIVCEKVHGSPPTYAHQAAHSCGNGKMSCVNPHHLSWKTQSENEQDKLMHGTHNRGERHVLAKLTDADVLQIRALSRDGKSQRAISKHIGISLANVGRILRGESWAWLKD